MHGAVFFGLTASLLDGCHATVLQIALGSICLNKQKKTIGTLFPQRQTASYARDLFFTGE